MPGAGIFGNLLAQQPRTPESFIADRQANEASGLTNALSAAKLDEYQQGLLRDSKLRNMLASGAGSDQLIQGGFLKEGMDLSKNKADVGNINSQEASHRVKAFADKAAVMRSSIGSVPNPQAAARYMQQAFADPDMGPVMKQFGTLEEALSEIPNDPNGFRNWQMQASEGIGKLADHAMKQQEFGLKANNELIGPDGKPNSTLIGVKTGLAKAGAASTNVNVSTGQKGFDNELKLRGDFKGEPVYKAHQEMQAAYSQIQQSLKQATPAGDLAGATKIMKLLDPGSVVRESELGMAMAATGLLDRAQNYAQNIISGNKLTPKQRIEFQQLADALYGESVKAYNAKRGEYTKLGAEYGLNADRAIGAPASANAAAKSKLSPQDQQAAEWANANPDDPRSAKIKQRLGM
jgi:hypothetical protein